MYTYIQRTADVYEPLLSPSVGEESNTFKVAIVHVGAFNIGS